MKIERDIIKAKKFIVKAAKEQNKDMLIPINMLNRELCLAAADFKCQRCKTTENLQIHHLINRKAQGFMDFWRYASQRHYWANIIVLCKKCHMKYHKFIEKDMGEEMGTISQERIKEIKKKYEQ